MNPFEVSRTIGNNLSRDIGNVQEQNKISKILADLQQNPEGAQNAMNQILSQVSQGNRGDAMQAIQNMQNQQASRSQNAARNQLYQRYGIPENTPDALAMQIIKDTNKNMSSERETSDRENRLSKILGNNTAGVFEEDNMSITEGPGGFVRMSDDQLIALSGEKGYSEPAKQELKRRQEDRSLKQRQQEGGQKETLDVRKKYLERGEAARKGIENKRQLYSLIEQGNLDDPTFAAIAESLPLNLGKRLLSPDTVTYKAGLVDEFSDLRNIFQGQTRVKEIDLLENKLADIYLTDDQKKAILKSRIDALQADVVKEEAAQEAEEKYPGISLLKFQKKVNEIAKPKLDKLFDKILMEQKNVVREAEERKELPLDPKDPHDYSIMQSLLREAGGDKKKAKLLARKKGYRT